MSRPMVIDTTILDSQIDFAFNSNHNTSDIVYCRLQLQFSYYIISQTQSYNYLNELFDF